MGPPQPFYHENPWILKIMVQTIMHFDAQRIIFHPFRAISCFLFLTPDVIRRWHIMPFQGRLSEVRVLRNKSVVHANPPAFPFLGRSSKVRKGRDMSMMGGAHRKNATPATTPPHHPPTPSGSYRSRQYLKWGRRCLFIMKILKSHESWFRQ